MVPVPETTQIRPEPPAGTTRDNDMITHPSSSTNSQKTTPSNFVNKTPADSVRAHTFSQPRCAPVPVFDEPEEGAQMLRVTVDRDPAAPPGMPARDFPVDVRNPDSRQDDTVFIQAVEKSIDSTQTTTDRLVGPSAFFAHPGFKDRDLVNMSVSRHIGFFQHVDEPQPAHRVAEECSAGLWRCGLSGVTPAGK